MIKVKYGKIFFKYDQIDYYYLNQENDYDLFENQNKTGINKLKYDVLVGDIPSNNNDLDFLHFMEKIGFSKQSIDQSKFEQINTIFVEKEVSEVYASACIPIFRDILVFKDQGKIIGIAKICFTCDQSQIVGTAAETENFGMDGDYERLKNILGFSQK